MAEERKSLMNLFGFELVRKNKAEEDKDELPSIVPPTEEDGAGLVTAAGSHLGHYVDIDGGATNSKDNRALINSYRGISHHPEVDTAIEEIVNESIVVGDNRSTVEINVDKIGASESVKKKITEEFHNITNMLNFGTMGHDIFRSWYVDGRIFHHLVVDPNKPQEGIQEMRYIDAANIRKVKQVQYSKDPGTGVKTVKSVDEFFVFEEKTAKNNTIGMPQQSVKLTPESVSYVTSGLLSEDRKQVVSFLHKALKPVNQLRMMEDSLVIYRLARAPERRIFYIDVGSLPKGKADSYMKDIMSRYRNKLVYDASTGMLKDDRKHMSMLEDFWLPRREGGRGTEISTLPGGENLGQIDDIIYFQKRLYRSLNVPLNRLEQEAQFSLGRSTEITKEEVNFQKFIDRLRNRFSNIFLRTLKKQLLLKGICTEEDWEEWKNDLFVDFMKDNHFTELKETEVWRERLQTVDQAWQYAGEMFSKEFIMKEFLKLTEEEYDEMVKQIDQENADGVHDEPEPEPEPQPEPAPTPVTVVDAPKPAEAKPKKAANETTMFKDEAELDLLETVKNFLRED
jgi:hypothetical protein